MTLVGLAGFLLTLTLLAAGLIKLVDTYPGEIWTGYWAVLSLFSCYAIFMAIHIACRFFRNRFSSKPK